LALQYESDADIRLGPSALSKIIKDFPGLKPKPVPKPKPDGGGGPLPGLTLPGPGGSTAGVNSGTFRYDSVLPPLSPEAQRAFMERRRAATRAEEEARAQIDRQRLMAESAAVQGRGEIARQQGAESRAGMGELASRGVARSPLFTNPFQRAVARQAQQRVGELEMGLSQTLENLNAALQQAAGARERELSQIEMDMLQFRSNIPRLLGVE
jgi:hypothetical protein